MKNVAQQRTFPPDEYVGKVFWCDNYAKGAWVIVRARTSGPCDYSVEAQSGASFIASWRHLSAKRPDSGPKRKPKPW